MQVSRGCLRLSRLRAVWLRLGSHRRRSRIGQLRQYIPAYQGRDRSSCIGLHWWSLLWSRPGRTCWRLPGTKEDHPDWCSDLHFGRRPSNRCSRVVISLCGTSNCRRGSGFPGNDRASLPSRTRSSFDSRQSDCIATIHAGNRSTGGLVGVICDVYIYPCEQQPTVEDQLGHTGHSCWILGGFDHAVSRITAVCCCQSSNFTSPPHLTNIDVTTTDGSSITESPNSASKPWQNCTLTATRTILGVRALPIVYDERRWQHMGADKKMVTYSPSRIRTNPGHDHI